MDLNARIDVNCGRKDGRMDGQNTGRLYRTLLKQVRQKWHVQHPESLELLCEAIFVIHSPSMLKNKNAETLQQPTRCQHCIDTDTKFVITDHRQ